MTKRLLLVTFGTLLLAATPSYALPRDADAVLNHCGNPLKGDETIYEDTVAGGRRILRYERGTLNFDRVGNSGWTFTYGSHGKVDHLDADQMSGYLPCLKDALIESASAAPLTRITAMDRATVSMKRSLKEVIAGTVLFLVVLGLIFVVWSRRPTDDEGLVG